jgi:hypothetical protein
MNAKNSESHGENYERAIPRKTRAFGLQARFVPK